MEERPELGYGANEFSGDGVSGPLEIDTAVAFQTAQSVGNQAEELRDELDRLVRDWDNLSYSWQGIAASAYGPVWDEWHENAMKVVDNLAESSRRLIVAVVAYEEQDATSAQTVESASGGIEL